MNTRRKGLADMRDDGPRTGSVPLDGVGGGAENLLLILVTMILFRNRFACQRKLAS